MKKIITIVSIILLTSCSIDNSCDLEKERIINKYKDLIEQAQNIDSPDAEQIDNLREGMMHKLENAC